MVINILLLVLGFALLIKGADFLVDGASGIAKRFGVSAAVIGLTIVAFGTSAPEISVAFQAFASSSTDITLGDVLGCTISNVFLLLGIAAVLRPIPIRKDTIKIEIPLYLVIAGVFAGLIIYGQLFTPDMLIPRWGGVILVLLFLVFLAYTVKLAKQKKGRVSRTEKKERAEAKKRFPVNVVLLIIGILGVIFGSNLVVNNATLIAAALGVSEKVIAMTIVALGTSLPELMTTISATRKGEQDLLIGNVIGSNIFNICFVLGVPMIIFGGLLVGSVSYLDLIFMGVAAALLLIFALSGKKITRIEGAVMLMIFAGYYTVLFAIP